MRKYQRTGEIDDKVVRKQPENFWIDASVEGRRTAVSFGGSAIDLDLYNLSHGKVEKTLNIVCSSTKSGTLDVKVFHSGKCIFQYVAKEQSIMSKWKEIRNDFIETTSSKYHNIIHIDAWGTNIDDEQGKVIAKVFEPKDENEIEKLGVVYVEYIDEDARTDKYAQEVITETVNSLLKINA